MQTNRLFFFLLFLSLFAACAGEAIETVENRDTYGNLERFERRKKDFAREGRYQRFNPEGKLLEEAHYRNDSLDGERRLFYTNGQVDVVEHYDNGTFSGKYQKFSDKGALMLEQVFEKGQIEGPSIAYYANGTVAEKVMFKNGEENGPFTEYYSSGVLKTEGGYVPGEDGPLEDGELREYDSTGTLVRIANCKRGICQTQWKKE